MIQVLVPLKRVPDPFVKVKPLPDGSGLDTGGTKHEVNPFDEIALEAAVQLREKGAELGITVISVGSSAAEEQLRKGLAMGADTAILIESEQASDSLSVAQELANVAKTDGVNLVIMGKQATDDDCNQASQMVAAKLGWNYCSCASQIQIVGDTVEVRRETDFGEQKVRLKLPAVISADLRLAEPRYIALPGIIKARSKPLEKRPQSFADSPKIKTLSFQSVPARSAGKRVQSVPELVEELKKVGVLN